MKKTSFVSACLIGICFSGVVSAHAMLRKQDIIIGVVDSVKICQEKCSTRVPGYRHICKAITSSTKCDCQCEQ